MGLTHGSISNKKESNQGPQEWINWQCGNEKSIAKALETLDILVLNHGINPKGLQNSEAISEALEVNALSTWRLLSIFEGLKKKNDSSLSREIWVNTSEAEIQPALSPGYEISKRLIGQIVSLRWNNLNKEQRKYFKIRKLVLGPFFSELNPIGIMSADFVANQIIKQVEFDLNLIIITPNPITYIMMPLHELCRTIYSQVIKKIYAKTQLS